MSYCTLINPQANQLHILKIAISAVDSKMVKLLQQLVILMFPTQLVTGSCRSEFSVFSCKKYSPKQNIVFSVRATSTFSFSFVQKDYPSPSTCQVAQEETSLWEKAQEASVNGAGSDPGGQLGSAWLTPLDGRHLHRPIRFLRRHSDLVLLGGVCCALLLPQVRERLRNTLTSGNCSTA